mgnify:CR=1 FL=1
MPKPSFFTLIINQYLPEPHASLLNGILFGINLKTTKQFYTELKMVGLLHLVVLSGMNITILSSIISSVTGFLSKKISTLIVILTIILFVLFVGPEAPIIRAASMGILTHVAILTGRLRYSIFVLFLSFIFTLLIGFFSPATIKPLSLLLSYGATLGIILFGQSKLKQTDNNFLNFYNQIKAEFKTSLAAQIFTAPIIFIYFKQISLISPLANVLVSFLVPVLMVFGLLTAVLGKIYYLLGFPFAWVCYLILSYIIWVVKTLSKIPGIFISFK